MVVAFPLSSMATTKFMCCHWSHVSYILLRWCFYCLFFSPMFWLTVQFANVWLIINNGFQVMGCGVLNIYVISKEWMEPWGCTVTTNLLTKSFMSWEFVQLNIFDQLTFVQQAILKHITNDSLWMIQFVWWLVCIRVHVNGRYMYNIGYVSKTAYIWVCLLSLNQDSCTLYCIMALLMRNSENAFIILCIHSNVELSTLSWVQTGSLSTFI